MKPTKSLSTTFSAVALALGAATLMMPDMAHADSHVTIAEHGTMHVTKSPTCGCCTAWVALAREAGYEVETTDTRDYVGPKQEAGVPGELWACHTATIDGYIVEGHVPFAALAKLLEERPDIAGIAVPGMPGGSPGMGNDPSARYDVIAFGGKEANGKVFYQAGL
ncbi:hypothetical protein FHS72_003011 [Loktanella ponticola]|uniref:CopG family transcriptional regulator n=1 Tax=Yoonia ponticola TaxID=1524255 RepID=A0A7W9BMS8_9RHOB|nr:DUF411 domain-containing protein [Yoonia ponticola]MBB5723366.1 hypothetical protein [Yoonia ponticola]